MAEETLTELANVLIKESADKLLLIHSLLPSTSLKRVGIFARGKAGAGKKPPVFPKLNYQGRATFRTFLIRLFKSRDFFFGQSFICHL